WMANAERRARSALSTIRHRPMFVTQRVPGADPSLSDVQTTRIVLQSSEDVVALAQELRFLRTRTAYESLTMDRVTADMQTARGPMSTARGSITPSLFTPALSGEGRDGQKERQSIQALADRCTDIHAALEVLSEGRYPRDSPTCKDIARRVLIAPGAIENPASLAPPLLHHREKERDRERDAVLSGTAEELLQLVERGGMVGLEREAQHLISTFNAIVSDMMQTAKGAGASAKAAASGTDSEEAETETPQAGGSDFGLIQNRLLATQRLLIDVAADGTTLTEATPSTEGGGGPPFQQGPQGPLALSLDAIGEHSSECTPRSNPKVLRLTDTEEAGVFLRTLQSGLVQLSDEAALVVSVNSRVDQFVRRWTAGVLSRLRVARGTEGPMPLTELVDGHILGSEMFDRVVSDFILNANERARSGKNNLAVGSVYEFKGPLELTPLVQSHLYTTPRLSDAAALSVSTQVEAMFHRAVQAQSEVQSPKTPTGKRHSRTNQAKLLAYTEFVKKIETASNTMTELLTRTLTGIATRLHGLSKSLRVPPGSPGFIAFLRRIVDRVICGLIDLSCLWLVWLYALVHPQNDPSLYVDVTAISDGKLVFKPPLGPKSTESIVPASRNKGESTLWPLALHRQWGSDSQGTSLSQKMSACVLEALCLPRAVEHMVSQLAACVLANPTQTEEGAAPMAPSHPSQQPVSVSSLTSLGIGGGDKEREREAAEEMADSGSAPGGTGAVTESSLTGMDLVSTVLVRGVQRERAHAREAELTQALEDALPGSKGVVSSDVYTVRDGVLCKLGLGVLTMVQSGIDKAYTCALPLAEIVTAMRPPRELVLSPPAPATPSCECDTGAEYALWTQRIPTIDTVAGRLVSPRLVETRLSQFDPNTFSCGCFLLRTRSALASVKRDISELIYAACASPVDSMYHALTAGASYLGVIHSDMAEVLAHVHDWKPLPPSPPSPMVTRGSAPPSGPSSLPPLEEVCDPTLVSCVLALLRGLRRIDNVKPLFYDAERASLVCMRFFDGADISIPDRVHVAYAQSEEAMSAVLRDMPAYLSTWDSLRPGLLSYNSALEELLFDAAPSILQEIEKSSGIGRLVCHVANEHAQHINALDNGIVTASIESAVERHDTLRHNLDNLLAYETGLQELLDLQGMDTRHFEQLHASDAILRACRLLWGLLEDVNAQIEGISRLRLGSLDPLAERDILVQRVHHLLDDIHWFDETIVFTHNTTNVVSTFLRHFPQPPSQPVSMPLEPRRAAFSPSEVEDLCVVEWAIFQRVFEVSLFYAQCLSTIHHLAPLSPHHWRDLAHDIAVITENSRYADKIPLVIGPDAEGEGEEGEEEEGSEAYKASKDTGLFGNGSEALTVRSVLSLDVSLFGEACQQTLDRTLGEQEVSSAISTLNTTWEGIAGSALLDASMTVARALDRHASDTKGQFLAYDGYSSCVEWGAVAGYVSVVPGGTRRPGVSDLFPLLIKQRQVFTDLRRSSHAQRFEEELATLNGLLLTGTRSIWLLSCISCMCRMCFNGMKDVQCLCGCRALLHVDD
ncbi:hypothetical protein KIPB_006134, partial [Kipferlia bialata]